MPKFATLALHPSVSAHVRYWPIADIPSCTAHVRFGGEADMTVCGSPLLRSLLGVKQTSHFAPHMSASDPKRTLLFRSSRVGLRSILESMRFIIRIEIVLRGQRTAAEYRGRIRCPPRISPVAMLEN